MSKKRSRKSKKSKNRFRRSTNRQNAGSRRKISAVLLDFAQPLLDAWGSNPLPDRDLKTMMMFAAIIWNVALLPSDSPDHREIEAQMGALFPDGSAEQIYRQLLLRRRTVFEHDRRIILKVDVMPLPEGERQVVAVGVGTER